MTREFLLRGTHDRDARSVPFGNVTLANHLRFDLLIARIPMIGIGAVVPQASPQLVTVAFAVVLLLTARFPNIKVSPLVQIRPLAAASAPAPPTRNTSATVR